MTDYKLALTFHLLGVVTFFGGMAVVSVGHRAALRRDRPSEVALVLGVARAGVLLVATGFLVLLGFGFWLVEAAGYAWDAAWISASLVLAIAAGVAGSIGGRTYKRARLLAERLAREGDAPTPELRVLLGDRTALVLNYGAGLAALAALVLMVWKP